MNRARLNKKDSENGVPKRLRKFVRNESWKLHEAFEEFNPENMDNFVAFFYGDPGKSSSL